jgi:hypothetical protein
MARADVAFDSARLRRRAVAQRTLEEGLRASADALPLDQQSFHGVAGITEMALNWYASWDFTFELQELGDLGSDRCVLLSEFRMTGAESGVPLDHVPWAQIGTARRGRWIRVDNFTDRHEALRAAGLSA